VKLHQSAQPLKIVFKTDENNRISRQVLAHTQLRGWAQATQMKERVSPGEWSVASDSMPLYFNREADARSEYEFTFGRHCRMIQRRDRL
jgi:hypothetical protein